MSLIRYYETYGQQTTGTLRCAGTNKVYLSDVTERFGDEIACEKGKIQVTCSPYEIQTLRIVRKK